MNKNSAEAQRARLLRALRRGPVDTVSAYRKLDILHVPRRVFELRKLGHCITTSWVWRVTEAGERHRVGLYVLEGR
ncbi:helix-turn-helix domain-containing protein [Paraburkholderia adhaesiva]|uniref:helix-turn-helix domain-containing protein n=1 Tax=Paraburkholderia adhaesiva TaxID=2883244 RepID=UPI001F24C2F3|nr:helix-turn-helix domain-containing protein [Paraburkholderia adhaesiva]